MKRTYTLMLVALLALSMLALLMSPAMAKRAKPESAYISSARIAIVEGRPAEGIVMLDTLLSAYGPHAEAYYWMSLIEIDLMGAAADLEEKRTHVEKLVAYGDSLHWTCDKDNKDVKNKYKKDCDKFIEEIDSLQTYFWKTFYNAGVEQIIEVEQLAADLANATDSAEIDYFSTRVDAQIDSCIDNMHLAILIDPNDSRTYTGIASAYEKMGKYEVANEWLDKALKFAVDSSQLLIKVAYNHINLNSYCNAIPYFDSYVNLMLANPDMMSVPDNKAAVLGTMYNLTVCLNNCNQFDSAYAVTTRMLELDPDNPDVLTNAGRYHKQMALNANDSANTYREAGDMEAMKTWQAKKNEEFEKALGFLQRSFELQPESLEAAEEFALIAALLQKFELAATGFERVTALDASNTENWTSLGDCYVALKEWQKAADAYEESLKLQPDNKSVMEQLVLLYNELGQKKRASELETKIKNM